MVIVIVSLSCIATIFLLVFFGKNHKKTKRFLPRPVRYEDGYLYYENLLEYTPIDVYISDKSGVNYYLRRGRRIKRVTEYDRFRVEVDILQNDEVSVYEIYHTHIIPQTIRCKFSSGIIKYYGKDIVIVNNKNKLIEYLIVTGAKDVTILDGELVLSVYDRAIIVVKGDKYRQISKNSYLNSTVTPPCIIKTPDYRLNEYLNFWVWDEIGFSSNTTDFDTSVAVCALKLCYTKQGVGEFLKISLFDDTLSVMQKALVIRMLCEYASIYGTSIFSEKIGAFTVFDYTVSVINRGSVKVSQEGMKAVKIYLIAVCEFVKYANTPDLRAKLVGVMDKISTQNGVGDIRKLTDKYLAIYFGEDNRQEVKRAVEVMLSTKNSTIATKLKYANPLWLVSPILDITPLGGALLWRAVMHDIIGIKNSGGNLTFTPTFPNEWKGIELECLTDTGVCKIEFKSANCNIIKVDGVNFTGGFLPKGFGRGRKIEVYFSK